MKLILFAQSNPNRKRDCVINIIIYCTYESVNLMSKCWLYIYFTTKYEQNTTLNKYRQTNKRSPKNWQNCHQNDCEYRYISSTYPPSCSRSTYIPTTYTLLSGRKQIRERILWVSSILLLNY